MVAKSAVLFEYAIFEGRSEGILDDFMMLAQGEVQAHINSSDFDALIHWSSWTRLSRITAVHPKLTAMGQWKHI